MPRYSSWRFLMEKFSIIRSETWLKQDILNAEIFPPTYTVYHRDIADRYWGVPVATKANLITQEVQHVTSTAEVVFIQVQTEKKTEPLIVGSLCKSQSATSEHQMEEVLKTLDSVKTNSIVWMDLNFPVINWKDQQAKTPNDGSGRWSNPSSRRETGARQLTSDSFPWHKYVVNCWSSSWDWATSSLMLSTVSTRGVPVKHIWSTK